MSYCTIEEAWGGESIIKSKSKNRVKNKVKKNNKREKFNNDKNKYPDFSLEQRGLHNNYSRKNRLKEKQYIDDNMDVSVRTSRQSKSYINNNPSAMNEYDENYQEIESQVQNRDDYDIGSEYNLFSKHDDDLEKINNSVFIPREDVIDQVAPYNDIEDNYHEQGGFNTQYSTYDQNQTNMLLNGDNNQSNTLNNNINNVNNSKLRLMSPTFDQPESETIEEEVLEGYQDSPPNNQTNSSNNLTVNSLDLKNIMDRLDNLEKMIHLNKKNNNNVHDIILFIIIGIFILFALDSIFKIGKNTI